MATAGSISSRGRNNVDAIMPKISALIEEKFKSPASTIDLSTAENWLIRTELMAIYKAGVNDQLEARHLSYAAGFAGDPTLLDAFAAFFNQWFKPRVPVETAHLSAAPGAAGCLDALLFNICEPGDGVLVPAPYWNGFDFLFSIRSDVLPVPVHVPRLHDTPTSALIPALSKAFEGSKIPIKGLILTNPHNPTGQCYPRSVIEDCLRFCQERDMHFVSDEVYALSLFKSPDIPDPVPFTSVLELDPESVGCHPSRVHVVWSTSKDLGSSGFRMGVVLSQSNEALVSGVTLASSMQTSALSAIATTRLLTSPEFTKLVELNSRRLAEAYTTVTSFLKRHQIEYIPGHAGVFLLAKLAPEAKTWEDEARMVKNMKEAGVLVAPGRIYHVNDHEKGWARLTFAVDQTLLQEALSRMETAMRLPHLPGLVRDLRLDDEKLAQQPAVAAADNLLNKDLTLNGEKTAPSPLI